MQYFFFMDFQQNNKNNPKFKYLLVIMVTVMGIAYNLVGNLFIQT